MEYLKQNKYNLFLCKKFTMILRGAANTQTEKIAHIHPTTVSLKLCLIRREVQSTIIPKRPRLKKASSFAV